jgi:hypothetical protein
LVQNHAVIKERKEELDAVMEKEGSVSSLLGKQPKPLQRGRKRNRDEADPLNRDPKDYVGMRVAKYFPGEGTTEELYFGTIDYISVQEDDEILWHVRFVVVLFHVSRFFFFSQIWEAHFSELFCFCRFYMTTMIPRTMTRTK